MTSEPVEYESSRPQFSLRAILIFLSAASVLLAVGRVAQVPNGALFAGSALCVAAIGFIAGLVVRAPVFSGTFALMMLASCAISLVEAMRTPWSLPVSLFAGWIGTSIYLLRPRSFRTVIQLAYGLTWAPLFTALIEVELSLGQRVNAEFFVVLVFIPLPAIVALLPFWSFGKSNFKSQGEPPKGMPRTVLHDKLWVGNARDLADVSGVLLLGVQAVVDLAANEAPVQYPRDIVYCRLPLVDGAENDEAILRLAVATTAEFIRSGTPTLVACSAGMSRSLAVAAAGLALARNSSPDQALIKIAAETPHDVSGALWADIKRLLFADRDASSSQEVGDQNLFADIPAELPAELFQTLLEAGDVRIERIVSRGQASPPGFWYDQPQSEWVLVVSGAARLEIEGGEPLELRAGSYVNIPAHTRHRVEWTDPQQPTIWLAVHYD